MTESNINLFTISALSLLESNPRKITKDQFAKLINSIDSDPDFLWKRPVLVNHNNNKYIVYAGNQRVRAAKKLGWKQIPCIIDKDIPDEIQRKRIIADNVHHGEFDWDILGNEWSPSELLDLGFTENQLHIELDEQNIEDEKPKKQQQQKTCPNCGFELHDLKPNKKIK